MASVVTMPEVAIELNGTRLLAEAREKLTSARVRQVLSEPAVCELTFAAEQQDLASAVGAELRVKVGPAGEELFLGQITAVEFEYGPSQERIVRLRAYDLLHRLRKRQPVRAFTEVSLADVAREIVADVGLAVDAPADLPVWSRLIQYRETDLHFLAGLADRCGLYLAVRQGVLHFFSLDGFANDVSLTLGESLLEARVELNGDSACRSVRAFTWDPSHMTLHLGRASSARSGRNVSAEAAPDLFDASGEATLVHELASDDTEAEALAQAELDARFAREVVLHASADGDPAISPGARVKVEGVSPSFAGTYVVTETTHTIQRLTGYVTELSSLPPQRPRRSPCPIAAWGTVTDIADPEDLARVRVSLPSVNDLETHWMEVVVPGAGESKGFVAQPDVNDRVLVMFPQGDFAHGVVLGGVYGPGKPPDAGLEEGAVRRYTLLTPGGQKVQLDDGQKKIRLELSCGSFLELSPEMTSVHSTADINIEAPGRTITIAGKKIDFRTK